MMTANNPTYHIIFPDEDMTKLALKEIYPEAAHQLEHCMLASRESFKTALEAHKYAKVLAATHSLEYQADKTLLGHEATYLD